MNSKKFYRELVRRNVFRAIVAYLAVCWVLIQIASTLLPVFEAPPYLLEGLIYLLAIGLIFWTGFSWVYDLTPKGIRKTPEFYDTTGTRKLNSKRLNAVIGGAGIAAILVLLAGSFWAGSQWNSNKKLADHSDYRIAVLPFEDRSDNEEFGYLRESLAEDVISKLCNISSLSVISSRSTFQFKDTDKSIEQISRELKADIILIGSYTIYSQNLDVKVEVIDGKDNDILNYASISGNLSQIRDVITRIGENIYGALKISDSEKKINDNTEMRDINIEAYKYNAIGKSAMHDNTGQKLEEITRYFQAAIDLDSTYVDPNIGMAEAFIFDVNRGYISPTEGAQMAKKYALRAEKLNPGSGEVSGILGIIYCLDFDFKNAIPYFEKSLERSPNYGLTYQWYAFALEILGDFDKAEALQKKVTILDPLNTFNDFFLALNYIYQGRLLRAEEVIDTKLALEPNHKQFLWLKAVLLVEKGLYDEAYEALLKRNFGLETNFIAGYVFTRIGQEDRAKVVLNNMLAASEKRYVPPSQIVIVLCGLKQYDRALEQLEEAFLVHDQYIGWIKFTSMADPIKEHPIYISLMTELGRE
jgi:TolB-like protein/Tfp pilus assembly protein PilF